MRRNRSHLLLSLLAVALISVGCPSGDGTKKIGVVLPITGSDAAYGESIKNGLELGLEQANAREDMPLQLTIDVQDSGSTVEGAVAAWDAAAADALAVIGGATSPEALALAPKADSAGKVLLSPTASSPELSRISQQFFRIFPSSDAEAIAMSRFLNDKGWLQPETTVALVADEPYGQGAASAMAELIEGGFDQTITFANGQQDITAEIAQVLEAFPEQRGNQKKAEVVFVAARGEDLTRAIEGLRVAGYSAEHQWIFATSALASPTVMSPLGPSANRIFFAQGAFDVETEEEPMKSFVADYTERYGEKPDLYAAHGFDAIQVLAQAVVEAGSSDPFPSNVLTGMRSISNFQGVTGNIQFRESGDVQKFARVFYVDDQVPVDYQRWEEDRNKERAKRIRELQEQQERLNRRMEGVQN